MTTNYYNQAEFEIPNYEKESIKSWCESFVFTVSVSSF